MFLVLTQEPNYNFPRTNKVTAPIFQRTEAEICIQAVSVSLLSMEFHSTIEYIYSWQPSTSVGYSRVSIILSPNCTYRIAATHDCLVHRVQVCVVIQPCLSLKRIQVTLAKSCSYLTITLVGFTSRKNVQNYNTRGVVLVLR